MRAFGVFVAIPLAKSADSATFRVRFEIGTVASSVSFSFLLPDSSGNAATSIRKGSTVICR